MNDRGQSQCDGEVFFSVVIDSVSREKGLRNGQLVVLGLLEFGQPLGGFAGTPQIAGEEAEVGDRRFVAVVAGNLGRSRGITDDGNLEALFKQFPQVRFDAQVGRHPGEDHLLDPPLAELQDKIVRLRADRPCADCTRWSGRR